MGLKVKIITPNGLYKETETDLLNVRSINGQLGILKNHLPLVTMLEIGEMSMVQNGQRDKYAVNGGIMYVGKDETTIITDAIESQNEIDIERAQKAKERAEKNLSVNDKNVDIARAQLALKRAINRISVSQN